VIAVTAAVAVVSLAARLSPAMGRAPDAITANVAPAPAAVITPALAARLATADPTRPLEALVVLRQQAALSSDAGPTHGARVTRVVQELRRVADATQKPLLALLGQRRAQQLVTNIVPLWVLNGVIVTARPVVFRELAERSDVLEIRPAATVSAPAAPNQLTSSPAPPEQDLAVVNTLQLWDLGYRGQGIVVANMDTGVDASHPDLAGSWRGGSNSWYDPNGQHPHTPTDVSGHGTWTMGTMVGGSASGTAIGMAPGAKWIAAKIFNDRGTATTTRIHQAFQWLLDPDGNPKTADAPDVVNNSWVMSAPACNLEFELDLQRLRAAGILPVFAAGNDGPAPSTGHSPADNPEAFAVGATNNLGVLDDSSSRGPGCGGSTYPNLTAPGSDITTTDLSGYYATESGTSMAAPHVAGALALLLSAFPNLSADRQAAALQSAALDLGGAGPDDDSGYGRLDALGAFYLVASTPDFSLSVAPSPATTVAGGTASYTVTIGSVGGFSSDVTPSVSGLSESQASWKLSPQTIAGGAGTASLTIMTASSLAPGTYGLTITTGGGQMTHTVPVSLIVTPPPDFTVTGSPSLASAVPGGPVSHTATVGSVGDFAGPVSLSLFGLSPSPGNWTFSPATLSGSGPRP
jgi:subtilisin family serine protease